MDERRFDALTALVAATGSRRAFARFLAGSTLAGVGAGVALRNAAAAKATPRQAKTSERQPARHAAANQAGQPQAASPGNGPRKKHRPHGKPPSCEVRCSDGSCVTREQCCPDECVHGACGEPNRCCPGEKRCADAESPTGFACVGATDCCPGEKHCGDRCIPLQTCCPDDPAPLCGRCDKVVCLHGSYSCVTRCCHNEKRCADGHCVAKTACCPGERRCDDGSCIAGSACCPGERACPTYGVCAPAGSCCLDEKRCANGTCVPENQCCSGERRCANGACAPQNQCCSDEKRCADGSCIPPDQRCPCPQGEAPCGDICIDPSVYQCCGGKACWADSTCCGSYCCPQGMTCCHGTCCW